jgi:hypothetical protein
VGERREERASRHATCRGADGWAHRVERHHPQLEPAIDLSEQRVRRHETLLETDSSERMRRRE